MSSTACKDVAATLELKEDRPSFRVDERIVFWAPLSPLFSWKKVLNLNLELPCPHLLTLAIQEFLLHPDEGRVLWQDPVA